MSEREKRRILLVLSAIVLLLVSIIVYLTYFQLFMSEEYRTSSKNRRNSIAQEKVVRGSIYDRRGNPLAYTEVEDGGKKRVYPMANLYSHIVGYDYQNLGKAGLELHQDQTLVNTYEEGLEERIKNYMADETYGADIHLSLDSTAQEMASDLLAENKGSIVALDPKTGRIIAMVSKPDFDPNNLVENWEEINQSEESVLFNRSINGMYPPGSVMKIVSATSILENDVDLSYNHTGSQDIIGYEYTDATSRVYGNVGMETAFSISLNTYFVSKIQEVGREAFEDTASRYMFGKEIDFELPVSTSKLNIDEGYDANLLAASSIGQGNVLATPLEMALVAGAVANNGAMMQPYMIDYVSRVDGETVEEASPSVMSQVMSEEEAGELKDLMVLTTNSGTGSRAALPNTQVAGKTGTAENATGTSHAWYVGFAPADDPKVAVAVIIEGGTSGGTVAAPIAREMLRTVLSLEE